jgi:tRNA nucleotidyltransferase (CCA-adding enzyme)
MNLWDRLQTALPPGQARILVNLGHLARRKNTGLYLVGGAVRDLLMGRSMQTPDLDLVVEGDAIALAHAASMELRAALSMHKQFGTATLSFENGASVDLATARTETYKNPGALPRVQAADTILQDLARRDFTINALAASVASEQPGELVDPHGGADDLEQGLLRVLHPDSFMDDPTRIFRGIRFQHRFDFGFEYETNTLLHSALDAEILHRLSGARLRKEITACFEDPARVSIINELNGLNIDSGALAPGLGLHTALLDPDDTVRAALDALCAGDNPLAPQEWVVYLMAACHGAGDETLLNLARRIALSRKQAAPLLNPLFYSLDARAPLEDPETGPAEVENLLAGAEDEVLVYLYAAAAENQGRERVARFVHSTRAIKLEINGSDLLGMGHEPSPIFAKVLREVRRSKIQGNVKNRRQELALARKLLNAWD